MGLKSMAFGCGLSEWSENSEIVHATSSDAEGPYTINSTVVPHFAHGPSLRQLVGGGWHRMDVNNESESKRLGVATCLPSRPNRAGPVRADPIRAH